MFSDKVLVAQIEIMLASKEIEFEPQIYEPGYSRAMTEHLETLWDKEKLALKRKLAKDEQRFIDNELLLCRLSYQYWADRYVKILDFSKELIYFNHNVAQKLLLSVMAEMEEAQEAIMIQLLKLRQLGCSSLAQRIIAWRTLFYANTDSLVGSNDPDKSRKLLSDNVGLTYEHLPWWQLKSIGKKDEDLQIWDSGELYCWVRANDSAITIQHGTQKSGLARGSTPLCIHLTELPDFNDPRSLVEGSLMNAVHENPFTFFILESTASTDTDWWHDFWQANKELWPERKCRFRPLFIPWYVGTDVWPTKDWLTPARRKQLSTYKPSDLALAHARRAREYVSTNPLLSNLLGAEWQLPSHQMMFWEYSRAYALKMNLMKQWLEEVGAADDEECFQSGGMQVVDYETIERYASRITNPEGVYLVESSEISQDKLIIPERLKKDVGARHIEIIKEAPDQIGKFRATLRELKFEGYSANASNARLFIWEPPQPGYEYTIAYDDAAGLGQDSSAIEVLRHATYSTPAVQAAEWNANNYDGFDAWAVLLAVAEYYSTYLRQDGEEAKVVIELARNGEAVQKAIQDYGWTNLYARFSRQRTQNPEFLGFGWQTNESTRAQIIYHLLKAIRDDWFVVNSPYLLKELKNLTTKQMTKDVKILAKSGYHDDRCTSIGMALAVAAEHIAPNSISRQTDRHLAQQRIRNFASPITPSQAANSSGTSGLISFGSQAMILPELSTERLDSEDNF